VPAKRTRQLAWRHFYNSRRKNTVARGQQLDRVLHRNRLGVLAFLLSAIEEYSEAPDIPEGSGASSISDSAMVLLVRWMSTAIVHGSRVQFFDRPRWREASHCGTMSAIRGQAIAQSRRFVDAIGCSMVVWRCSFASKTVTCGPGCLFFISCAAFSAASYVPNPDLSCRSTAT
jgi:hypothetical protein